MAGVFAPYLAQQYGQKIGDDARANAGALFDRNMSGLGSYYQPGVSGPMPQQGGGFPGAGRPLNPADISYPMPQRPPLQSMTGGGLQHPGMGGGQQFQPSGPVADMMWRPPAAQQQQWQQMVQSLRGQQPQQPQPFQPQMQSLKGSIGPKPMPQQPQNGGVTGLAASFMPQQQAQLSSSSPGSPFGQQSPQQFLQSQQAPQMPMQRMNIPSQSISRPMPPQMPGPQMMKQPMQQVQQKAPRPEDAWMYSASGH